VRGGSHFGPLALGMALALASTSACGGGSSRRGKTAQIETPSLPPVKPEALAQFDAGMRALRLGGPEGSQQAVPRLLQATAIDATLWEAWHNVGVLRFREGDDEAAIEAFSEALKVNPAHMGSVLARAEAHRRSGNKKRARADYQLVLSQDPDSPQAPARLASLLRETRDYESAIDVLREALRRAGATARIYVELSLVYLAQGRDELAELVLAKAAELDDSDPTIYNALALVALARGDDQLAFERFNRATSLDPGYNDARFNKANVLLEAGDYAGAMSELDEVVKRDPEDLHARVALGIATRGQGNYDRARKIWEEVAARASRRSQLRGDALYNLAVLETDFGNNEKRGIAALDRFLQEGPRNHPNRQQAEERRKELGQ
jgi:tetratricopeptide (TPR) repeat protein